MEELDDKEVVAGLVLLQLGEAVQKYQEFWKKPTKDQIEATEFTFIATLLTLLDLMVKLCGVLELEERTQRRILEELFTLYQTVTTKIQRRGLSAGLIGVHIIDAANAMDRTDFKDEFIAKLEAHDQSLNN